MTRLLHIVPALFLAQFALFQNEHNFGTKCCFLSTKCYFSSTKWINSTFLQHVQYLQLLGNPCKKWKKLPLAFSFVELNAGSRSRRLCSGISDVAVQLAMRRHSLYFYWTARALTDGCGQCSFFWAWLSVKLLVLLVLLLHETGADFAPSFSFFSTNLFCFPLYCFLQLSTLNYSTTKQLYRMIAGTIMGRWIHSFIFFFFSFSQKESVFYLFIVLFIPSMQSTDWWLCFFYCKKLFFLLIMIWYAQTCDVCIHMRVCTVHAAGSSWKDPPSVKKKSIIWPFEH